MRTSTWCNIVSRHSLQFEKDMRWIYWFIRDSGQARKLREDGADLWNELTANDKDVSARVRVRMT